MNKKDIENIIKEGTKEDKLSLYAFDSSDDNETVLKKFKLFVAGNFPQYIKNKTPQFHNDMVLNYIKTYRGEQNYLNIGFRNCAKTTLKKLFDVFALLNDQDKTRKHFRLLTNDRVNARRIVTDIYNMILEVEPIYGNKFINKKQGEKKGETTRYDFDFKDGRRYSSTTLRQKVRGAITEDSRPDFQWADDIEDSDVVKSIIQTTAIIDKLDEAIQGGSNDANYVVTANYISDEGVIEWIKKKNDIVTTIVPIIENKKPTWPEQFNLKQIYKIKADARNWEGDYLCRPTNSRNKFFGNIEEIREAIRQSTEPIKEIRGFKIWEEYKPGNKYVIGADTSEGVEADANTATILNTTTNKIVGMFSDNTIPPDEFGKELANIGTLYGECLIAVERNNTGHATIGALKALHYGNIYRMTKVNQLTKTREQKYGWLTSRETRDKMFYDLKAAIKEGVINIPQKEILEEIAGFTHAMFRNQTKGGGTTTNHYDLLIALAIAWQIKSDVIKRTSLKVIQF